MRKGNVCVFRRHGEDLEGMIFRFQRACKKENIVRTIIDHAQFRTDAEKENEKERRNRIRGSHGRRRRRAACNKYVSIG